MGYGAVAVAAGAMTVSDGRHRVETTVKISVRASVVFGVDGQAAADSLETLTKAADEHTIKKVWLLFLLSFR